MKSNLIFNHRGCTFTDKTLRIVLKCMLANDNLDDDAEYYALSFIKNKIVLKTYDDLDFHEFILKEALEFLILYAISVTFLV